MLSIPCTAAIAKQKYRRLLPVSVYQQLTYRDYRLLLSIKQRLLDLNTLPDSLFHQTTKVSHC